jgi:hypothetical protein
MSPMFFCIGAQKSGTSWLFRRLKEHPEFFLPVKEFHYFDRSSACPPPAATFAEPIAFKRLLKHGYMNNAADKLLHAVRQRKWHLACWYMKYYFGNHSDSWYGNLFKNKTYITGDITPCYSILDREDVARMQRISPRARLVFMMRNPIESLVAL